MEKDFHHQAPHLVQAFVASKWLHYCTPLVDEDWCGQGNKSFGTGRGFLRKMAKGGKTEIFVSEGGMHVSVCMH